MVVFVLPRGRQWPILSAVISLKPNTFHLWLNFAMTVFAHTTAWTVTQCFWTIHRAGHTR